MKKLLISITVACIALFCARIVRADGSGWTSIERKLINVEEVRLDYTTFRGGEPQLRRASVKTEPKNAVIVVTRVDNAGEVVGACVYEELSPTAKDGSRKIVRLHCIQQKVVISYVYAR